MFQSPIHGSPTTAAKWLTEMEEKFQSPIHGSPTTGETRSADAKKIVSIPYTRVTNFHLIQYNQHYIVCFNPLYTGHQRLWFRRATLYRTRFNPLYTGHQRNYRKWQNNLLHGFNPLYTGHQRRSNAYKG